MVATQSDLFIERITLRREWVSASIHELENFFDSFVHLRLVVSYESAILFRTLFKEII